MEAWGEIGNAGRRGPFESGPGGWDFGEESRIGVEGTSRQGGIGRNPMGGARGPWEG